MKTYLVLKPFNTAIRRLAAGAKVTEADLAADPVGLASRIERGDIAPEAQGEADKARRRRPT